MFTRSKAKNKHSNKKKCPTSLVQTISSHQIVLCLMSKSMFTLSNISFKQK